MGYKKCYQQLYQDIEEIVGEPGECKNSDARAALNHLKVLATLPPQIVRKASVAMFYLSIAEVKLHDAHATGPWRSFDYLKARRLIEPLIEKLVGPLPQMPESPEFEATICRLCA